ncbi:uncharacterized protein LOC119418297 [Nematolebias whitei]|uniref:uncharacterized protein LOC119418297 n=1 Tax=Nematolebias whitei TaxID=451745 RepID=UPI001899490C|nr:uncharacterized protein LOC119418297 [Nematolebias whitei]
MDFQAGQDRAPNIQAGPNTRSETSRQKRPRDRTSSKDNHVSLKICILEDSDVDVVSPRACQTSTVHELQCPCGLQEADFLNLLKSTFPALAAERPIEPFITDRTKKLHPLMVESFTPEQVCRAAGYSALYLRLKRPAELQTGQEEPPLNDEDDDYDDDYDDNDDSSRSTPHVAAATTETKAHEREGGPERLMDEDAHIKINVCFLDGPQVDAVPPHALNNGLRVLPGLMQLTHLAHLSQPPWNNMLHKIKPSLKNPP